MDPTDGLVRIDADESEKGIELEYEHVSNLYGQFGIDWHLVKQRVSSHEMEDGSEMVIDTLYVRLSDLLEIQVRFDIRSFYGK